MAVISDVRDHAYDIQKTRHGGHYPVYFRHYRGFHMDNRRHEEIDCETYDTDPMGNDLAVIAIWGTGLGKSYKGNWGTVTNRCRFGSYRGEQNTRGRYSLIIRKSVKDFPEHGKTKNPRWSLSE